MGRVEMKWIYADSHKDSSRARNGINEALDLSLFDQSRKGCKTRIVGSVVTQFYRLTYF